MPLILHCLKFLTSQPYQLVAFWLVTMIPVKPRNVVFSLKRTEQDHPPLSLDTKVVKDVESHTHLGLTLKSNMWWRNHIVN